MAIEIVLYRPEWPNQFQSIGMRLREILGDSALRINHIGSTSVPGLAAKNIIDIQISVVALAPEIDRVMNANGINRVINIDHDHQPPSMTEDPTQWEKWYFRPPSDYQRCHLHMRIEGRANQRYAVLFRDYLRATPLAAQAYAQIKVVLSKKDNEDVEFYYAVKDPICDIIMAGAEEWARRTGWMLSKTDV